MAGQQHPVVAPVGWRQRAPRCEALDHPGRLMIASATGGPLTDLLPGYEGDIVSIAFKDDETITYVAH